MCLIRTICFSILAKAATEIRDSKTRFETGKGSAPGRRVAKTKRTGGTMKVYKSETANRVARDPLFRRLAWRAKLRRFKWKKRGKKAPLYRL